MHSVFALLVLILGFLHFQAQAESPRGMTPVDMVELQRLSDPELSPDGKYLLYQRSETLWAQNKIVNRYQLIDLETRDPLPVPISEKVTGSVSAAWWRPDSRGFIFLGKPNEAQESRQAYFYDLATQKASRLTYHGTPVEDILWRPDSSGFYFVAAQQQPEADTRLLNTGWIIPSFEANAPREIWTYDLDTETAKPVIYGRFSIRDVSLSRDGNRLTFTHVPNHELNSLHAGEVLTHTVDTGETLRWTTNTYTESNSRLSPDGSALAFIATVNARGEPYYEDKVFLLSPDSDRLRRLMADRAMEALDFAWDKTGKGLFILGNTGLSANLYHYTLKTRELRQLTSGQQNVASWTYFPETDSHIARIETAASPGELFLMRDLDIGFKPVTSHYADWAETFRLPKQEAIRWRGRRGARIEGLLVYPIDYQAGQRYPLVTITHGGPRSSSRFGSWQVSRYLPVLAAQGYMVLLPNHRGGTGYGDRFMRDMYGTYFRNAHHDVMDGIEALVERGLADPDRLIKMGWSAGGHMTNKLITHSNRFKAASSGAGAADWLSMHGESDVRHHRRFVFGGTPWEREAPRRQYTSDSPLKDAWKVTTPTLFFVGEEDARVPPTQSILMYRGVQATGTPTLLYQAEGEAHNFRKPANQLFKINTELSWFARFALGKTYEAALPDEAYQKDAPQAEAPLSEETETAQANSP